MLRMLFLALLAAGGDDFAAGVRAYRDGRFQDALAAFTAAAQRAGAGASPELLHDLALAALRTGDVGAAEAAAERAAARGGDAFAGRREFVRGNVAFARGQRAAAQAETVEAEPFAFDAAIALVEAAAASWQRAAQSRDDWPQARRNVERALLRLDELKRKKAAAEAKRKRKEPDQPKPLPAPDPRRPEAQLPPVRELSADELARVFDLLAAKEKEKLTLRRRVAPPPSTAPGAEDW